MRAGAGLVLVMVAGAIPAAAQERPNRWAVGHSYTSIGALRQPATLMALRANGGPWLTKLDVGVLATLPTGAGFDLALGARASAGSARSNAERVVSAIARTDWSFPAVNLGMALGAEYESDTDSLNNLLAGVELTPIGWGAAGLGRFTHRRMEGNVMRPYGLRWRPWIGGAVGDGFRGHARIEAALRIPIGRMAVEGAAEATAWYIDGFNGTNWLESSLSLEIGGGWSLSLTLEEGRRPPAFARTSRAAIGAGFRWPPPAS